MIHYEMGYTPECDSDKLPSPPPGGSGQSPAPAMCIQYCEGPAADNGKLVPDLPPVPSANLLALADRWDGDASLIDAEGHMALHRLERSAYRATAERIRGMSTQLRELCRTCGVKL